ncbi:hypothetical protein L2U69_18615 [Zavarzinia compransoris]|uniref:hypothetical protein n=1 Tax=Zavarzinia marina TaxID=2911065 RepID=UPI001F2B0123|nr:hypothetical protein [Zavarzinia marina]MCF4167665.1 hypothetical protein [Zavarzinia marina]
MENQEQPAANAWIEKLFQHDSARDGGVIRRKIANVDRFSSTAMLEAEVKRRGFHLILCGDQYLIVCSEEEPQVIC